MSDATPSRNCKRTKAGRSLPRQWALSLLTRSSLVVHIGEVFPSDGENAETLEASHGLIVLVFGIGESVMLGLGEASEGLVEVGEGLKGLALLGEDGLEGVGGGVVFGGGHMGEGHMNKIVGGGELSRFIFNFFEARLPSTVPMHEARVGLGNADGRPSFDACRASDFPAPYPCGR